MEKAIVYQQSGKTVILYPVSNSGLTVEEIATKDVPTGVLYKIINVSELPTDREFRNAWSCDADMNLTIDMEKARDVWRDKIRIARKPKLAELDVQYMRAQEAGEDTSAIVATKNKLRDFPAKPEITSASTVEELKVIWDSDLDIEGGE